MFIDKKPPKEWPYRGQITFTNFFFRYSTDEQYVLKNLNINIKPMEKVMFSPFLKICFSNINTFYYRSELLAELVLESHP